MCEEISAGTAKATEYINNNRARVTEWRFAQKGDNTGWHKHEYDYVVIPMFDGLLSIKDEEGVITEAKLQIGIPD